MPIQISFENWSVLGVWRLFPEHRRENRSIPNYTILELLWQTRKNRCRLFTNSAAIFGSQPQHRAVQQRKSEKAYSPQIRLNSVGGSSKDVIELQRECVYRSFLVCFLSLALLLRKYSIPRIAPIIIRMTPVDISNSPPSLSLFCHISQSFIKGYHCRSH